VGDTANHPRNRGSTYIKNPWIHARHHVAANYVFGSWWGSVRSPDEAANEVLKSSFERNYCDARPISPSTDLSDGKYYDAPVLLFLPIQGRRIQGRDVSHIDATEIWTSSTESRGRMTVVLSAC